jgi:D-glucuronyl C5-epimerase C-terminus
VLVVAALAAVLPLALPAAAQAARVLVMGAGGRVSANQDAFVPTAEPTPAPAVPARSPGPAVSARSPGPAVSARAPARIKAPQRPGRIKAPQRPGRIKAPQRPGRIKAPRRPGRGKAPQRTVTSELARLRRTNAITSGQYSAYSASLAAALRAEKRLRGTRATELEAVIENLHQIAASGMFSPARLPALFETLDHNRQWWTTGPLLGSGQYVEFAGSQLVWEYYPGQGIELQVLATFSKANGLDMAGPAAFPQLQQLLSQMIPLAVPRAGGLAWEYYFKFGGGNPPWTSAMSQGTAIEALTRAYQAFGDASYLQLAHQALALFTTAPPVGVRVATPLGARYVQYSFTPGTSILNAFLQSLIGLFDYAQVSRDPFAMQLFAAGNAEAQAEVPHFDTGAWSLYQPGVEDTLSYHELVTGFLQELCTRTAAPVYCVTAQHFTAYLTTPPVLQLLTQQVRKGKPSSIWFRLSKYSQVGIVLVGPGGHTLFLTSASFGYGIRSFAVPALKHKGTYTVRLAATDLAGNFSRIVGTIEVF